MAKREFCYLYLTCENSVEAAEIAEALLDKHLIVCAKQVPVEADYWWEGSIEHNHEMLLIMESRLDLFEQIEKAVAKIHSYDTFVLEAVPIAKVSQKAKQWMEKELKHD